MRNATVGARRRLGRLLAGLRTHPSTFVVAAVTGSVAHVRAVRHRLAAAVHSPGAARGLPRVGEPHSGRRIVGSGAHRVSPPAPVVAHTTSTDQRTITTRLATARLGAIARIPRERLIPIGVAALVIGASAISVAAGAPAIGGTGNATGSGSAPRIAVGGPVGAAGGPSGTVIGSAAGQGNGDGTGPSGEAIDPGLPVASSAPYGQADPSLTPQVGPFLADGTLLMPVAVNTTVPDGSGKLVSYKVQSGDTLTGIAHRFGVSMMSIWWANKLTSKDELHIGQVLVIPPVNGLVVTVASGDTLDSIAARTGVSATEIYTYNGLADHNLVIGQKLIVPGAVGKAIPTPKPVAIAASRGSTSGGGATYHPAPATYSGGTFDWPVPGGFISQYFWWGHQALDIAGSYGTPIVAAAAGVVIWAGWRDNEGGYQVWISHGSGLYTGYYHMSAITVAIGEHVGRGSQIGRVGMSGVATGPHCHFEVWRGYPWAAGSYRVNPLGYF